MSRLRDRRRRLLARTRKVCSLARRLARPPPRSAAATVAASHRRRCPRISATADVFWRPASDTIIGACRAAKSAHNRYKSANADRRARSRRRIGCTSGYTRRQLFLDVNAHDYRATQATAYIRFLHYELLTRAKLEAPKCALRVRARLKFDTQ